MSKSQCTLDRYLKFYRERHGAILEEYHDNVQKMSDYKWTVYTTWAISFKRLSTQSATFLQLCAYLHHDGISEALFQNAASNMASYGSYPVVDKLESEKHTFAFTSKKKANVSQFLAVQESGSKAREFLAAFGCLDSAWDSQKFSKMITEIRSYSLIEFDTANQTYSIHPLVHAWIPTMTTNDKAIRACTQWILGICINKGCRSEDYSFIRTVLPHIDTMLKGGNSAGLEFYARFGRVYSEAGRWKEAEELEVQVKDARLRMLGAKHPSTLVAMGNLAVTYCNQGRWKEAEELQLQVKNVCLNLFGADHSFTASVMGNLAVMYSKRGRWKEAEEVECQIRDARHRVLGAEHPDTLLAMGNLAETYGSQGRWKDAEELQLQVKGARLKILGADHLDTLLAMKNLAVTYFHQLRWKEAEELELHVKDALLRVLGTEHPDTLSTMGDLAVIYEHQGRLEEAEELQLQVKDARLRVLGPEHPDTLLVMGNLAVMYCNQNRWKEV